MIPETLWNWNVIKLLVTSFIYKKFRFDIYPTDLVNTKTTTPLVVGW